MKIGPLVLFEHEVTDEVYAPAFRDALGKLESKASILNRHGLVGQHISSHLEELSRQFWEGDTQAGEQWDAHFLRSAEVLESHIMTAQTAHNRLVDVWPRKALRAAHRELIFTMKAYLHAMMDAVAHETAIARGPVERIRHHAFHGRQWDNVATERAVKLVRHLRKLQADEPKTFGAMVGPDLPDAIASVEEKQDSVLREYGVGTFISFPTAPRSR
jgi:hypothetical protein